jgi:transcriptional regulator with XRE-family HTH domain
MHCQAFAVEFYTDHANYPGDHHHTPPPMTGSDLKHLRLERGLTLRQLAEELRDVSPSALSLWERNADSVIPEWIREKLLNSVSITMPLSELEELLSVARLRNVSFAQLLAEAIREHLSLHSTPDNITPITPADVTRYESRASDSPRARVSDELG